ncbi:MAG: hypothetical protein R2695_15095 [Acidimicrobiales bacterium]
MGASVKVLTAALSFGCGSGDPDASGPATTSPSVTEGSSAAAPPPTGSADADVSATAPPVVVEVGPDSFRNINDMTPVRGSSSTISWATWMPRSRSRTTPVAGRTPGVRDPARAGRGHGETRAGLQRRHRRLGVLRAGALGERHRDPGAAARKPSTSSGCPAPTATRAASRFDFVCEDDHGCDPLPIGDDVFAALRAADPRPRVDPAP